MPQAKPPYREANRGDNITPPIAASAIPYVGIVVDLVPGSCSFGFSVVDGDGDGVGADEEGVFVVTALELKT